MWFALHDAMVVILAAAWVMAVFLSIGGGVSLAHAGGAVALLGAGLLLTGGSSLKSRLWAVPLGLLGFAAGLGVRVPPPPRASAGGTASITCEVVELSYRADRAQLDCAVIEGSFIESGRVLTRTTRLRLRVPIDEAPARGSIVHALARLRPAQAYRNLSPHPPWPWVRQHGFQGKVLADSLEIADGPCCAWMHAAREHVRTHLLTSLGARASPIARALALGEAGAVATEDRSTVAAAGLAHVLAVSGLHVAMVSGLFVAALRRALLRCSSVVHPIRVAALAGIPLSLLYAAFAGGTPSGWRAAATASITWALVAAGRKPRSLPVAALAALVLSIPDPTLAVRPAFLLSVLATAAIVTGGASSHSALFAAATATTRAIVATIPVVWWCFGNVPWVGWVANLVLLPLGTLALIPLANLHALSSVVPWLETGTAPLFEAVSQSFLSVCEFLVSMWPKTEVPSLTLAQGAVVCAGCLALLMIGSWRRRTAVVAMSVALLLAAEAVARHRPLGSMEVAFLDVGQGDSALVDMPDGRIILIDAGGDVPDPGTWVLAPLLKAKRRTHIDVVVITHPHPDHYQGLIALADTVHIGELWTNRQAEVEAPDGPFVELLSRLKKTGTTVRYPAALCDGPHAFGDATARVLWPCPGYDPALDPNDNSLVIKLEHAGHSIVFTGDIEAEAEDTLAHSDVDLRADVLKVAHHGSTTSSHAEFLKRVGAQLSVISSGMGNRYGHPAPSVLQRLDEVGTDVLRIDESGSVIVSSHQDGLSVHTWRDRAPRAIPSR